MSIIKTTSKPSTYRFIYIFLFHIKQLASIDYYGGSWNRTCDWLLVNVQWVMREPDYIQSTSYVSWYPTNRLSQHFVHVFQSQDLFSSVIYRYLFFFNGLRWEIIVCFAHIIWIIYYYCLNFLFISWLSKTFEITKKLYLHLKQCFKLQF